jgi:ankyrin repeat protein
MSSILQELIKSTADTNIVDEFREHQWYKDGDGHKRTALMWVIIHSKSIHKEKIIKRLIDATVDINLQENKGFTALMMAARYSNLNRTENIIKMLIDAGANIDLQMNDGWTALMMAARNSNTTSTENTVKMLIDANADINLQKDDRWTALMLAARYSHTESTENTVKMLIDAGADVNLKNSDGWTALMMAARFSTENTVKMLIDAGTNVNLQANDGQTALIMAVRNTNTNSTEKTVKMLIDANSNINLQDNEGRTAFKIAYDLIKTCTCCITKSTVKMLIDAGAISKPSNLSHINKYESLFLDRIICLQLYDNFNFGITKDRYLNKFFRWSTKKEDHKYVEYYYKIYFSRTNLIAQLKQIDINHIHYKPGAIRQRINMLNVLLTHSVELDQYKDIILYLGVCNVVHLKEKIKFYIAEF